MLDELIAAGKVLWAASTVGEADSHLVLPDGLGPWRRCPLTPRPGWRRSPRPSRGSWRRILRLLDAIVRHVLVAQGPLAFRALTDGAAQLAGSVARTDREVAEALR